MKDDAVKVHKAFQALALTGRWAAKDDLRRSEIEEYVREKYGFTPSWQLIASVGRRITDAEWNGWFETWKKSVLEDETNKEVQDEEVKRLGTQEGDETFTLLTVRQLMTLAQTTMPLNADLRLVTIDGVVVECQVVLRDSVLQTVDLSN